MEKKKPSIIRKSSSTRTIRRLLLDSTNQSSSTHLPTSSISSLFGASVSSDMDQVLMSDSDQQISQRVYNERGFVPPGDLASHADLTQNDFVKDDRCDVAIHVTDADFPPRTYPDLEGKATPLVIKCYVGTQTPVTKGKYSLIGNLETDQNLSTATGIESFLLLDTIESMNRTRLLERQNTPAGQDHYDICDVETQYILSTFVSLVQFLYPSTLPEDIFGHYPATECNYENFHWVAWEGRNPPQYSKVLQRF